MLEAKENTHQTTAEALLWNLPEKDQKYILDEVNKPQTILAGKYCADGIFVIQTTLKETGKERFQLVDLRPARKHCPLTTAECWSKALYNPQKKTTAETPEEIAEVMVQILFDNSLKGIGNDTWASTSMPHNAPITPEITETQQKVMETFINLMDERVDISLFNLNETRNY